MANKTCQICGKPSGMYPICLECNKLKEEGKVTKCDICGKWYIVEEGCCENKQEKTNKCLACGKEANNGPLCLSCYKEKERVKKEFKGNRNQQEIKDHYFAQRSMLYKIKNPEYIMKGIIRLIAIS